MPHTGSRLRKHARRQASSSPRGRGTGLPTDTIELKKLARGRETRVLCVPMDIYGRQHRWFHQSGPSSTTPIFIATRGGIFAGRQTTGAVVWVHLDEWFRQMFHGQTFNNRTMKKRRVCEFCVFLDTDCGRRKRLFLLKQKSGNCSVC